MSYPYNNPVSEILRDFTIGRRIALILSAGHILLALYQFSGSAAGTDFWANVHLSVGTLIFVVLYYVTFTTVPTQKLKDSVTEKAYYEDVLYDILFAIMAEKDVAVRERLFNVYLKRLRSLSKTTHMTHLQHLSVQLKEEMLRVCRELITQEKEALAGKLKGGLNGAAIRVDGEYIERLETIARHLGCRRMVVESDDLKGNVTITTAEV